MYHIYDRNIDPVSGFKKPKTTEQKLIAISYIHKMNVKNSEND